MIARYLRIPFVQDGRDWSGADCYGLIWLFFKHELGVELQSFSGAYASRESMLARHALDEWEQVDQPRRYDVVLFQAGGQPKHIGLLLEPRLLLHTSSQLGYPVVERMRSVRRHPEGYYRCKKLPAQ